MFLKYIKVLALLSILYFPSYGQDSVRILNLNDVIQIAQKNSPKVLEAESEFLKEYWQKRTFTANFLPQVSIGPIASNYNRSLSPNFTRDDFIKFNSLQTSVGLNVSQNIAATGGQLQINSNVNGARNLSDSVNNFVTNLYSIGYTQPLNFFNAFKWQRKIAPLKWEQSKRRYVQALEQLSIDAVEKFFSVIIAQINHSTAELNYANADTLYRLSSGRYKVGTILESDLLQMELNFLQASNAKVLTKIDLGIKKSSLLTFLGMKDIEEFELIPPVDYPALALDFDRVLDVTKQNNPELLAISIKVIESEKALAQARANRILNAQLGVSYGKNSASNYLSDATNKPSTSSGLSFNINIPIIDYGLKKGAHRIAQLDLKILRLQVDQELSALDQRVLNTVSLFNNQSSQLQIAAKLDTIAQKRFFISKQRFLKGRIDILDLNKAITDKDNVRSQYYVALLAYWNMFYQIRQLTLYDFVNDSIIEPDYSSLLKRNR